MGSFTSEVRVGMQIDWDVPIKMDDGLEVRADIFRPIKEGKYPVIITYGPYAKYLHFEQIYKTCWDRMIETYPEVGANSTNQFQSWEVVDPEKWVPEDYVVIRVDSRGCGRSPGYVELWSAREAQDFAICIDWAGTQSWSNGKVGINGISYYGMNQWQVAALQPKHLAAMCIWEGANDFYRDLSHHGGILCNFIENWYDMQVKTVQYGLGKNGHRSKITGDWVSGPDTLTTEELGANRFDFGGLTFKHEFDDEFWTSRTPDYNKIKVPLLSAGNWGGQGLHTRGNVEGFVRSASDQKWLEMHGIEHWTHFYTDYGRLMQLKFFDYFLKGEKNGWDQQPKVLLNVRHPGEKFTQRAETTWPLASTQWTKMYLDTTSSSLGTSTIDKESKVTYRGLSEGVTFLTSPLAQETEITGQLAAKLFVSSSTNDADMFLIMRIFDPNMKEITFQGALDPNTPIAQGWLRASHRELDPKLSLPYRPYHPHTKKEPLKPGEVYELDIEILPTSIVVPAGYRIGLTVRGKDYVYPGATGARLSNMKYPFTGVGPFTHNHPGDRPPEIFDGEVSLHTGPNHQAYILLPIIPKK
ncbi:peptidase S15 [Polynucleobacter sp. SHI8]|uniref:CocE/NonD family hydrolase n=1 Tax=unclassified Polynucleobacter TaxID=2640945 RepID=UPI002493BAA2|nr:MULTISPECIES: CocE/NonD family hydrolase [unclassified Polynucleobacter]BDW10291.1 peptidase S15 [Polynucleobacter sp. SHI2]BDW12737.1 peptidase S15 [Polynucleobacter sp. SHI8]